MTYKEFNSLIKDIYNDPDTYYESSYNGTEISVKWETGGMSGGSCWGSEAKPYTSNEPPKELDLLDAVLLKIKPDMSYLQYKCLNKIVKHKEDHCWEYYGNSTDYMMKIVSVSDLYEWLFPE